MTSTDCSPTPTISYQHASTRFHIFPNMGGIKQYFQILDVHCSFWAYIYKLEKVNMWFKALQFSKGYALFDKVTLLQPRQTIINTSMESFQINFHIFPLLKFSFFTADCLMEPSLLVNDGSSVQRERIPILTRIVFRRPDFVAFECEVSESNPVHFA